MAVDYGEPHMGITRRNVLSLGSLAALGAWPTYSQPDAAPVEARRTTFDEVWEMVRDRFYDRDLHGLDWPAVRRRYQPMADVAETREQLAVVINAMLAELGTSHTQFYTPEDTAYYQLVDIFIDSLRRHGLDRIFPSGEVSYSGIGSFTSEDDQHRTVVTGVVEDTPAHQAGLLIGDEILAADDLPFRPVASFQGKVLRTLLAFDEASASSSRATSGSPVGEIARRIRSIGKLVTPGANPPQPWATSAAVSFGRSGRRPYLLFSALP